MLSFTTIVTFLMSALLAFAGVIPPAAYTPAAAPPPADKGAVPPPADKAPPATVVPQVTWKCPPDQGLFKFQGQLEASPMRCAYKILGGIPYNCDYNMADGKLMYNINDFVCPPSAAKAY